MQIRTLIEIGSVVEAPYATEPEEAEYGIKVHALEQYLKAHGRKGVDELDRIFDVLKEKVREYSDRV